MLRTIIQIDEERCSGCGLCASACKENAIAIIDGKAKLLREDYCDGLGNCLPACPMGAISFVERDAAPFDEKAVQAAIAEKQSAKAPARCPGMAVRVMKRAETKDESGTARQSHLRQWPVQIRLAPVIAPFYQSADLLIAADCTAYAYASFHEDLIRDRIVLIGCTKLDDIDYSEKLGEILKKNDIRSVTVARMEVPCCGGMAFAAEKAIARSGKKLPMQTIIIGTDGQIIQ